MNDIIVKFKPQSSWTKTTKWELIKNYKSMNGVVTVPKGFITDGATIPRIMRILFSTTGRYFSAAIIHDYIIVNNKDWKHANAQFNAELKSLGISTWRRHILVLGVKFWGGVLKLLGVNSASEM